MTFYALFILMILSFALVVKKFTASVGLNVRMFFKKFLVLLLFKNIIFFKVAKLTSIATMFGHLAITATALNMSLFIIILFIILFYIFLKINLLLNKLLLDNILLSSILVFLMSMLWFANSLFSVIFIIDCTNILIVTIFFNRTKKINNYYLTLTGIASYFWASFIATMLLLLTCALMLVCYSTTSINSMLVSSVFLVSLNNNFIVKETILLSILTLSLFIKLAIGPFFMWKLSFFAAANNTTLALYIFIYFNATFIFIIRFMLVYIMVAPQVVIITLVIVVVLSCIVITLYSTSGLNLKLFFVISTLFNANLVICVLIAVAGLY